MDLNIDLDGRKLVKTSIKEQTAEKLVTLSEYDDGTVLEFTQVADKIDVKCNKALVVQPDGKTIKIAK